jgi:hypothetical protein
MDIEFFTHEFQDGTITENVKIDRGNDEFTIMTKAQFEAMQAEQSTPIVIDEAETK